MAIRTPTRTWQEVISAAAHTVNRNIEDKFAATAINSALRFIWFEYDFRETLAELPPFYLIPGMQDHGPPFSTVPSDFLGLRLAQLAYLTETGPTYTPLRVVQNLHSTQTRALPNLISFEPTIRGFRVFPRVPETVGAPLYMVVGSYKKRVPLVSPNNLGDVIPFDDHYFDVLVEAVKCAFYQLSGDNRAGGITVNAGTRIYQGQAAVVKELLDRMAENEGLNDGDIQIAPSEPLIPLI